MLDHIRIKLFAMISAEIKQTNADILTCKQREETSDEKLNKYIEYKEVLEKIERQILEDKLNV